MEVATTNNNHHHNQHHHHPHLAHQLHHPAHRLPMAKQKQQQQQSQTQKPQQQNKHCLTVSTAAAAATDNSNNNSGSPRSPFQREVREWQRIDPDTGALLSGRLEADRWINGPLNSYGKISDSQNISQPNGTQQTQRKQLEVLQKCTANGAVQVIRAQTVQTTSSRSWSSSNSNSASTSASASASASPICMTTNNVGGGRSILHNHIHNSNNSSSNGSSKHFHNTLQQHLAEANTHWLQLSPPTIAANVDISEVNTDDDLEMAAAAAAAAAVETAGETQYIVDDEEIDDDDGGDGDNVGYEDAQPCNYSICRSGSGASGSGASGSGSAGGHKGHTVNSNNNNSTALLPKPLPLSSSSSSSSSKALLHSQTSALKLPDTAPSLKLSNLMKSSSGGSTSSSSNNSTTMNTHPTVVGKVSLHTIVGGDSSRTNSDATKSPKSTTKSSNEAVTGTKTWQQHQQQQQQRSARHLEQATLYGQNSNSSKTRVGVADCDDCDDCYAVRADADESQSSYQHQHQHQHRLQPPQQQQQQPPPSGILSETTPTHRRDLESFRLYGGGTAAATAKLDVEQAGAAATAIDNAKDDDLRLSTRQLRRQQQPFAGQLFNNARDLQRSHSISTDDLSNDWETNEAVAESNEWRRVSKLRRSFQSSSSTNNSSSTSLDQSAQQQNASAVRRLYDLPTSSVSVSRIRAELESGRRLTTAMRNNHVDLAALENILHGPEKPISESKRNTLLTAESLKEIRARLKKLSDESLYKDDFIAYQQPPAADEHIEVQQSMRRKVSTPRLRQLTPEQSPEISTPTLPSAATTHKSAFKVVASRQPASSTVTNTLATCNIHPHPKHTSHSLESRQKVKDSNSTEWHSRRKSYGFEKMSPPDSKSMFRMDASTDSGLGRSGELGNWSPTESAPTTARATVIHFGEPAKAVTKTHSRAGKSPLRRTPEEDLLKRHSIAVDESQYVRDNLRKTSQVHLNGFYEPVDAGAKSTLQLSRYESNPEGNATTAAHSTLFQRTQNAHKRVEFCKTEVHFAAESGRVNIVETDGKPPPTNNFRRRRRTTSGPLQSLTKSVSAAAESTSTTTASNVTHFGDDRDQRHRLITSAVVAYKATLLEPSTEVSETQGMPAATNVTVSVQRSTDTQAEGSRGSYASTTSGIDTTDNENDEIAAIRGILKNKPVKPKPYHLGDNIDSADALWGVQLKPVGSGGVISGMLHEKEDSPTSILNKSVAERVRIVEKRRDNGAHNGYSTKINLSLDEPAASAADWPSAGAPTFMSNTDHKPIPNATNRRTNAQELILQDLREHQRVLDEGLKSTSLIIKTMRSANEFDEAMRRLSIVSLESTTMPPIVVPTPMLRSNSYQETVRCYSNASMDGTERELTTQTVVNTKCAATLTETTTTTTRTSTTNRRLSFESQSAFVTPLSPQPAPLVAPRLRLLANTDVSVSQQLSQLRRMYDIAATQQHDDEDAADSADEEVKSYFCAKLNNEQSDSGGGTLESSSQDDERAVEYSSGSWSRLKAKRTIWKIEAEERKGAPTTVLHKADLPKSNVMSIELHSPQISLEKRDSFKRNQLPPMAKPRTVTNAVSTVEQPKIHIATGVKQTVDHFVPTAEQRESLKIVKEARGARKLREHELSYFGVANSHKHEVHEFRTKLHSNANSNTVSTSKRTLPSRQRLTIIRNDDETKPMHRHEAHHVDQTSDITQTKAQNAATKWQLLNDKPDLLRHSPIAVEPQLIRLTGDVQPRERKSASVEHNKRVCSKELRLEDEHVEGDDEPDEHYYENITNEITPVFKVKSPQPYDRKMDVERDAYILSEMNENADLTMKALSDEAAHKDRRRRRSSLHRRDSKPLETIEEKMITHKPTDTCIAVKMSRGTLASEAKRSTARHTTSSSPSAHDSHTRLRTSSQSSVESCPRARSRSLSSEREYENIRTTKPTRTSTIVATKHQSKIAGKQQHRSSSRESQRSARLPYSSGDEVTPREEQRVRMKSKRSAASSGSAVAASRNGERHTNSSTKPREKTSERHRHHHQSSTTTSNRDLEKRRRAASSTTHASQREERAECVTVPQDQQRTTTSSGRSNSSKRREEQATHTTTSTAVGSSERHSSSSRGVAEKSRSANAGVRLLRSLRGERTDDAKAHNTEQRSSDHRTTNEREKLEREKEKQSKSRGHSTSKPQHHPSSCEHERMSSKTHERKSAAEKPNERATTPTHSKSSQIINGRRTGHHAESGSHKHSADHCRIHHTRHTHNDGATATSTHSRKRSEHSRRERK